MLDHLYQSLMKIIEATNANLATILYILAILWIVYVINLVLHGHLFRLGILPRRIIGLPGIVFAPFLHANFNHLFFNSIPLVVLSNFILIDGFDFYLEVTILITVISGTLIWLFGRPAIYVGASALITGYWGFLVADLANQPSVTSIILGIISLYYFFGIFIGIFPNQKGVAWEGHLFGLIAGLIVNFMVL